MSSTVAAAGPGKSPDLIPLDELNFSTPLDRLERTVVPTELFFVRSNNPPPALVPSEWRLRIDGLVRTPLTLDLAELQGLPARTEEVWLECAGNGRSHFDPPAEGNQWNDFAVGNAVFTGVPLRTLLERAQVLPGALEMVATGADADSFQRALPLEVAMLPEVLLAWHMNGQAIPGPNGGPVRMVVPRWAGIASVKWPVRLELVDRPFRGHFNAERYIFVDGQGRTRGTVREMPVKSIIAWPARDGTSISVGRHRLFGFAWSGHGQISRVDVSVDAGRT
ncbi:MAG: molybdopterin-dependent oxidoreductase, partial [Chloroflexota bacterium]|nr:molybdopterin-dependent oxidoreductase [Chloroflexota bacterium]